MKFNDTMLDENMLPLLPRDSTADVRVSSRLNPSNTKDMLNRKLRSKAGFTLIELLASIAIIAIFAAILIPVTGSIKRSASAAESVSNLRQIGIALNLFAGENAGKYPKNNNVDGVWWQTLVSNGFLTADVFRSPLDTTTTGPQQDNAPPLSKRSYALVGWGDVGDLSGKFQSSVTQPSRSALACTYFQDEAVVERPWYYQHPNSLLQTGSTGPSYKLPNNTAGILFVDGHVELLNRSEVESRKIIDWYGD